MVIYLHRLHTCIPIIIGIDTIGNDANGDGGNTVDDGGKEALSDEATPTSSNASTRTEFGEFLANRKSSKMSCKLLL